MDSHHPSKHSTLAAITIIRDASAAIEARLAVLTKDYPAEFDKAIEFFLKHFKPKDDAEAAEAAAWQSWLQNPNHVNAVARKAAGGVEKKVKRAEIGRAEIGRAEIGRGSGARIPPHARGTGPARPSAGRPA